MSSSSRVYMDSCCFIDLVKLGRGKILVDMEGENDRRKNDCWFLSKLCDASRNGDIEIVTSVLTVSECLHVGEENVIHQETQNMFMKFLTSGNIVELVEADIFIAEAARDLRWKHGIHLKGADAIHVATALDQGCAEFLTTDGRIRRKGKLLNAIQPLGELGLTVTTGSNTSLLPDEYRSDDLFGAGRSA